jgi:hypothetical protein
MTITIAYTAQAVGTQTAATIATAMAAVTLDTTLFSVTGLTLNSDSTAAGATAVTRTIVLNKPAAFLAQFPVAASQPNAVMGWMGGVLSRALRTPVMESAPVIT